MRTPPTSVFAALVVCLLLGPAAAPAAAQAVILGRVVADSTGGLVAGLGRRPGVPALGHQGLPGPADGRNRGRALRLVR